MKINSYELKETTRSRTYGMNAGTFYRGDVIVGRLGKQLATVRHYRSGNGVYRCYVVICPSGVGVGFTASDAVSGGYDKRAEAFLDALADAGVSVASEDDRFSSTSLLHELREAMERAGYDVLGAYTVGE